jgi:hypothetical protein
MSDLIGRDTCAAAAATCVKDSLRLRVCQARAMVNNPCVQYVRRDIIRAFMSVQNPRSAVSMQTAGDHPAGLGFARILRNTTQARSQEPTAQPAK